MTRLLRLRPGQREAIAKELRDHMEHRLADLLAAGVERDEAVRMALEEFGDAAGLASDFIQVARLKKRRWIMRATMGTLAASAAAVFLALAVWPEQPGPGEPATMQAAVGQVPADQDQQPADNPFDNPFNPPADNPFNPPGAAAEAPSAREQIQEDAALRNAATRERLAVRTSVSFSGQPLSDVLDSLAQTSGVQFYINRSQLSDGGVDPTSNPVELRLEDVSVEMLLDIVLSELDLGYTLRDGIVIVTSRATVDVMLEVRVYNIADLIVANMLVLPAATGGIDLFGEPELEAEPNPDAQGNPEPMGSRPPAVLPRDVLAQMVQPNVAESPYLATTARAPEEIATEALIDLITSIVDEESWADNGGSGRTRAYRNALVVTQTEPVHRKIDALLTDIRLVLREGGGVGGFVGGFGGLGGGLGGVGGLGGGLGGGFFNVPPR